MSGYQELLFEIEGGVAEITLNRPQVMNAWTSVMAAELGHALHRCHLDDTVHAVVLTGAGDRAFCAGADLSSGGDTFDGNRTREQADAEVTAVVPMLPHQISKPVIAAINGHAVGVGITYPMLADIRIVAQDAKIAFPFVLRGVVPEFGSHVTVAKVAGLSNAADLLFTGRTIDGAEAARLGIASRALPQAEVLPAAMAMARDIALHAAPASVAVAKRLLWEGLVSSVDHMREREDPLFAWMGNQVDAREGVTAFLEKRPPRWSLNPQDLPSDLLDEK